MSSPRPTPGDRSQRIECLRAAGIDPYPAPFRTDSTIEQLAEGERDLGATVRVQGRVLLRRDHGGVVFLDLVRGDARIQVLAERGRLGDLGMRRLGHVERGDVIGVDGQLGCSHSGERSVLADTVVLVAPSLRPVPDKRRRPRDPETRVREREVDLFTNPASWRTFRARAAVLRALRDELHDQQYTEVETPILSAAAGGATARPFHTHHHALHTDLYLRIAPELHLKRLVVGGMDRVFEIARVFRNEGIDRTHNPEFTILEAYRSPGDLTEMMDLVERLVVAAARAANGDTVVDVGGTSVDLAVPWRRVEMTDLVAEVTGERLTPSTPLTEARCVLDRLGIDWDPDWASGRCLVEVFDRRVEATLVAPTIVTGHPAETSPLARRRDGNPDMTDRFEVIVGGSELANAYSELSDPDDQRSRMQRSDPDGGLTPGDQEFVRALESGLPPTGGLGIGVDRLVMLVTGATAIRDVILFPARRPQTVASDDRSTSPVMATTSLPTSARPGAPVAFVRLSGLVRVVASLTTIVGVLTMLSALPQLEVRIQLLEELISPVPELIGRDSVLAVTCGLIMVLLSGQLLRGKRRAWTFALALFVVSAVLSLLRGGEVVALVTSVTMVVILLLTRREFTGLQDPPSAVQIFRLTPRYLVFVYGYGIAALFTQRGRLVPQWSLGRSLWAVTAGLFGEPGPYRYTGRFATWFPLSLVILGGIGLLLLLWLLLRPAVQPGDRSGRQRAAALVDRYGWDTLAPFALRSDRNHFFSSDGEAFVAYGYLGGFALVTGDPVGADESIPLVADEFIEFCRHHGWQPAVLAAREVDTPFYAERGFRSFYLGDEAILDCRRFSLDAPGMAPVRQSVRRAEARHRFEMMSEAEATPELAAALNEISRQWRKGEDERGYTMALSHGVGRTDQHRLLAVAWERTDDGLERPVAFLRLIPTGDPDSALGPGYTLDLMRRLPDAANGITEFLIARSVEELRNRGARRMSLNFAVFNRLLDDELRHSRMDRALGHLVERLNPYYQIRSLREFNEKFQPEWQHRMLVYADLGDLPKVGLRYAWLEGLVDVPFLGRLLSGPPASSSGHPSRR